MDVSGVIINERHVGATQELGENVNTELDPAEERRGISHTARPGLARCAGLVLARSANAWTIARCCRISPRMRAIDGDGCYITFAGEGIDGSCNRGRREIVRRPRDRARNGILETPATECDQSRSDVIPTPQARSIPRTRRERSALALIVTGKNYRC